MKRKPFFLLAFYCLFLSLLSLTGCMSDEIDMCAGEMTLSFSYTLNPENKDYFGEEVTDLSLYVFDEKGYLVQALVVPTEELSDEGSLNLSLLPGSYQAVAWGNLKDEVFQVTGTDSTSSDMKVELFSELSEDSGSLFFGSTSLRINPLRESASHVSFIQNTNRIRILLENVPEEGLLETGHSVRISGCNGAYYFDNTPASYEPVHYTPLYREVSYQETDYTEALFRILRLQVGYDVQIEFLDDGAVVQSDDLIALLFEHFPELRSDEDLDRYSEYSFTYRLEPGYFTLVGIEAGPWQSIPGQEGGI